MTRKGAIATYLEPWHNDIEDFIDLKKNAGEERRRAHDIFPALWISDLFMERVINDEHWSLFDPDEVRDLPTLYGDEFKRRYETYEIELSKEGKVRVIRAKDLWKRILTSYFESGSPFLCFKDAANIANPNPLVGRIRSSNLCFTGDTVVATADGRNGVTIKQLAEESKGKIKFPVYCAAEDKTKAYKKVGNKTKGYNNITGWKDEIKQAVAFKTGTKKVVTVVLENGDKIKCTPDHELALNAGGYVEAKDSIGKELKGFYTYTNQGPGSKYRHINSISNARKKQSVMMYEALKGPVIKWYHIDHVDNNSLNDNINNLKQLSVKEHLEKTRQERITDNPMLRKSSPLDEEIKSINKSIEVTGVTNPNFSSLSNVLLIELGKYVDKILPGEFDIHKYNLLRDYYNLNVPKNFSTYRFGGSFETYKKYVIGELTYIPDNENVKQYKDRVDFNNSRMTYIYNNFLKFEKINKEGGESIKNYRHSGLKVTKIIDNGEEEDVYDLTVDDNHNFYIITSTDDKNYNNCNGILVHNCTEVLQPTDDDHTAVCNLGSINLARVNTKEDIERVTMIAIRAMDNAIDLTKYPSEKTERTQKERRSVGLGALGEAELIAHRKIVYGSEEHLELIDEIYGTMEEIAIRTSKELAIEKGPCIIEDMRNAYLMCVAPNSTSGLFAGTTNSHEPAYNKKWTEENKLGQFTMTAPNLNIENYPYYKNPYEIDIYKQIDVAARRQKRIDMSQSFNIHMNPVGLKLSKVRDIIRYAHKKGLKTTYYFRSKPPKVEEMHIPKASAVKCSGCEN